MASQRVTLLTVALWLCLPVCLCDQNVVASVGTLFVHDLDTKQFQERFPSTQNNYDINRIDPITFRANLEGFPDLPGWLRYTQRTPWHMAYLYGCPTEPGRQVIEVTAYNRYTFETVRERIIFNIRLGTDFQTPYQAELLIRDWDVEELLPSKTQFDVKAPLQDEWGSQRLTVINISSALDKGGRVPLPLPGRKEGVYIKVGSDVPFPQCLLDSQSPRTRQYCKEGQRPPVLCNSRLRDFQIDWCNISLTDGSGTPIPVPPERGSGILKGEGEFNPPSETLEEKNYLPDYLLTLLLPSLLALLLFVLLCYIMCCRREGVEKRDEVTTDIQLVHHQTVFNNTEELRQMASNRDVPRPLSTLPMFNVRTGQRAPPMQLSEDSAHVPLILSQQ
ncbi:epsilon-sarcoglycan isoform X2 [Xenopus laevis]|uniref:Epsilon-sarcoglycan isoform X1 n=1 Tax=Xenopus laevis TaxID=8355 RepID=A0A8J0TV79_XENLA|nr:epsilon-sarcoglycan isoform X1 [Xenopus laevis]XP_018090316.1 epsilon-sarcoglycan isoform X2 [Xenopus laevis]